jgi:hypothetical protein
MRDMKNVKTVKNPMSSGRFLSTYNMNTMSLLRKKMEEGKRKEGEGGRRRKKKKILANFLCLSLSNNAKEQVVTSGGLWATLPAQSTGPSSGQLCPPPGPGSPAGPQR